MQAVTTKYLGPTNSRGGRVKAKADAGSLTVAWNHAVGVEQNHAAAAMALVAKLGWTSASPGVTVTLNTGSLPGDNGMVHVLVYAVSVADADEAYELVTYRRYKA